MITHDDSSKIVHSLEEGITLLNSWSILPPPLPHSGHHFYSRNALSERSYPPVCRSFSQIFISSAPVKKRGILLAIGDTISFQLHDSYFDSEGRFIILVCTINTKLLTLVSLYVPNSHQLRFLHKLSLWCEKVIYSFVLISIWFPKPTLNSSSLSRGRVLSLNGLSNILHDYD